MRKFYLGMVFIILNVFVVFGQEEWVPQKHVTGYVALQAEYFNGLINVEPHYGTSISEAGFLVDYKPLQELTFKSVLVYRPDFSIDQIVNEINLEYKVFDFLKFKAGRFLTPLSPINTYYYAPLNNSVTLPMIVSQYQFFPLNIDGVSINGNVGESLKMDYNLFAGGFRSSMWIKTGPLGVFGAEDDYFLNITTSSSLGLDQNATIENLNLGGGGHLGFSFQDFATVGFSVFNTTTGIVRVDVAASDPATGEVYIDPQTNEPLQMSLDIDSKKFSYGMNFQVNVEKFRLKGELWTNNMNFKLQTIQLDTTLISKGTFIELSRDMNNFIPYVRHEYHDVVDLKYSRYTVGLNYKPIFDLTFKLEYVRYDFVNKVDDYVEFDGFVGAIIYSF